jgi:hypothetical protein
VGVSFLLELDVKEPDRVRIDDVERGSGLQFFMSELDESDPVIFTELTEDLTQTRIP